MSITQQQAIEALGTLSQVADGDVKACVRVLRQYIAQHKAEDAPKLWLWKNFVNGRSEYWAFDNPYPRNLVNGDPQTLGEPCGYAIFKTSRSGRPDFSEDEVLLRIAQAKSKASYNLEPNNAEADAFDFLRFAKKNLDTHAARVPFAYNGLVTAAVAWIQAAENILAAQPRAAIKGESSQPHRKERHDQPQP